MAIKQIPQTENRKKLRIPLQGSPTITSSPHSFTNNFVQGCRYVNCYPVEIPQFGSDPIHILNKAPGIDQGVTLTVNQSGPLGAINWTTLGTIVQYFDSSGVWVSQGPSHSFIGSIAGSQINPQIQLSNNVGPAIKIYNQGAPTSSLQFGWYDAATAVIKYVETAGWTVTTSAMVNIGGKANTVPPIYLNQRMFFLDAQTRTVFNTDPMNGTITFTTGSQLVPQIQADEFFGMVKYRNHLCVIGNHSIEFFYDGGLSLGSPLVRQEQYLIRHGCSLINNITMYGDIMYFMGLADGQGWGLYEVANFNLRKVSPPGIDAILNNIDDFSGQSQRQLTINVVDIYGHANLLLQFSNGSGGNIVQLVFEIPKRPYGIMAPTDGQWWEWPAISGVTQFVASLNSPLYYNYPVIFNSDPETLVGFQFIQGGSGPNIGAGTAYANVPASFYFTYPTGTTAVANFISKNRAISSSTTGTYITDVMDFDTNETKHVDYIDAIGDFGNNTVKLSWTNDPTYQTANWVAATTQSQSTNGPREAVRWHNPGPFKQIALRYDFTGTSNIVFKGTEVSFNKGTL